jgi:hypothetical protein
MSSDFPTHSEIGEENVRQYLQRRCRERAEYGDAETSDNEREMRIHLEYENRIWGILKNNGVER